MADDPNEIKETLGRIKLKNLLKDMNEEIQELKNEVSKEIDDFTKGIDSQITNEVDEDSEKSVP